MPWSIDSTHWAPAYGTQSSPCAWNNFVPNNSGNPRVCRKPFTRSGMLTVYATVNGDAHSESVEITVPRSHVHVTASPDAVSPNGSVTFTASISPSGPTWNINSWSWLPDSGSAGQGISSGCGWNNNPCTRQLTRSGTMWVFATVDGMADTAAVHASCLPCQTGDSILDDGRIRRKLKEAIDASNANDTGPNRREVFGMRVRLPDGRVVDTNFTNLPGATPCRAWDPAQWDPTSVGVPLLIWHTHPFTPAVKTPTGNSAPASELLPVGPTGCASRTGMGAFPGPSCITDAVTGDCGGDVNMEWPQIVVDKSNVYWIDTPASPTLSPNAVTWQTFPRTGAGQCDLLTYY